MFFPYAFGNIFSIKSTNLPEMLFRSVIRMYVESG